jgi:K+-transporting ATPase ATPase B chain
LTDETPIAAGKPKEQAAGGLRSAFSGKVLIDSVARLNPKSLLKNPVMLIVEITFFIVAAMAIVPKAFVPVAHPALQTFYIEVAIILLITVWFSTLSDSLAEQQAKSTAGSLRKLEKEVSSKKIVTEEWTRRIVIVKSTDLKKDDLVLIEAGDIVPLDADVIEGIAMVDESLVTGESAPVRKAPGDSLIGGSRLASDTLTAKVTTNPGETFIDQMIKMVESSKRPKTPNEVAITMVLIGLTAIFTIIILALLGTSVTLGLGADLSVLIALYVCLLPTTIGALLPAIGLSGITRLYKNKIIAKSGRAIETAGDADVVLLDKTGTITVGNRQAIEFIGFEEYSEEDVGEAAFLSSWHDDTPEGRSILRLAYEKGFVPKELNLLATSEVEAFSAVTRTSGVKITHIGLTLPKGNKSGRERMRIRRKASVAAEETQADMLESEINITKGAPESIKSLATTVPKNYDLVVEGISAAGETPIAVMRNGVAIGIIRLKDVLKAGIKEKIQALKVMGIRPVMITGDQPLTAKSIAAEVGIDEYVAQAKPEDKYKIAKREQAENRIVAMIGDGTNDAPALSAADVGLAMNSGTEAAKEAANMVDLESNPAKIIDVVMLGKQLLMTRGAVTAFSIANDVSKYFAIMPVIFATAIPELSSLNILRLGSMQSAVLSALIFNAIIIPLLIPLAMRGIAFKPTSTMELFLKNTLIYGVGGVIVPFVGIKLIDLLIHGVFHV